MQITIGDIGAIAGVLIYRPSFQAHHFRKPHIIAIGYVLFALAVASYLWWFMDKENHARDLILLSRGEKGEILDSEETEEEIQRQGDRHIRYRYQI